MRLNWKIVDPGWMKTIEIWSQNKQFCDWTGKMLIQDERRQWKYSREINFFAAQLQNSFFDSDLEKTNEKYKKRCVVQILRSALRGTVINPRWKRTIFHHCRHFIFGLTHMSSCSAWRQNAGDNNLDCEHFWEKVIFEKEQLFYRCIFCMRFYLQPFMWPWYKISWNNGVMRSSLKNNLYCTKRYTLLRTHDRVTKVRSW